MPVPAAHAEIGRRHDLEALRGDRTVADGASPVRPGLDAGQRTVDLGKRPFTLIGDDGSYEADSLIIATGASARYLGLPSEEAFRGKGQACPRSTDGTGLLFYDVKAPAAGNLVLVAE